MNVSNTCRADFTTTRADQPMEETKKPGPGLCRVQPAFGGDRICHRAGEEAGAQK